jgi:diguanylate cyclase
MAAAVAATDESRPATGNHRYHQASGSRGVPEGDEEHRQFLADGCQVAARRRFMTGKAMRVLVIEDNAGDARLLREMFGNERPGTFVVTHLSLMSDAVIHLAKGEADIVLLDLGLPDAHGLESVRRAHAAAPGIPLIVLTSLDDEALAAEAMKEGAQDYLIKGQIENRALPRALRHAIDRHRIQTETAYIAQHDAVTKLPNRLVLNDRISQAISLARRRTASTAVMFVDLDRFKHINDSLGHAVGDQLLQSVSARLVTCVRGSDTVSRQGGDEFVILLSEIANPDDAAKCARRLLLSLNSPHFIAGQELHIDGSIGISISPSDGADAETLIKNADMAMYHAKEIGRNNFQFFKAEMNSRAVERQSLETSLRRAFDRDEFLLHYQPKVNLFTGEITSVEALIRWQHPDRGLVPPAQFVPIAEDCGLIIKIGRWVLNEACRQVRVWHDAGHPQLRIAVNVSAIEFRNKDFVEGVRAVIAETGLEARFLELELTESVLMGDARFTASVLQEIKGMGIRIAVDDFGTGYSSLSYLREFPIDILKIDRSFINQITADCDGSTIVDAIISMGKSLKHVVVAEGVETQDQRMYLQAHNCEEGQGYLFSKPLPAAQFAVLLQTGITETVIR